MLRIPMILLATFAPLACGGAAGGGEFLLVEFLEAGRDSVPRNRTLRFRFSRPVMAGQHLDGRLRIRASDFAPARGTFLVSGEIVEFVPRRPERADRSDAGLRAGESYRVYVARDLQAADGATVPEAAELVFETGAFFEDPAPDKPPCAVGLAAGGVDLAGIGAPDNASLVAAGRVIEPDFGGAFELRVSEPLDPATVDASRVSLRQVRADAFLAAPDHAPPGRLGDPVDDPVPVVVEVAQAEGDPRIRVTPLQVLADDARYRLRFSGDIRGLDFRQTFVGENGLGGGLGYETEFLVFDRPAIAASRTVSFDPASDGVEPETGRTTLDPERGVNTALYDPATSPGTAVGFVNAFGSGADGDWQVAGAVVLDTGDVPNAPLGRPFEVLDLNPDDDYLGNPLPGRFVEHDSPEPFVLELASLSVPPSARLRVEGVNPVLFRVRGSVDVRGAVVLAGADGGAAGAGTAHGGSAGAGGFAGGGSAVARTTCTRSWTSGCVPFATFLSTCPHNFPNSRNGHGPGRGLAGGEIYTYNFADDRSGSATGTGGGGGGRARRGGDGEDRRNAGAIAGTPGPACAKTAGVRNSGVAGVRGRGGAAHGEREIVDVTLGGSGGGAGGACFAWGGTAKQQAGGGGGGGGGSIAIVSAGPIHVVGGTIDAGGGDGGRGRIRFGGRTGWYSVSGGGGGGAGGAIALISGDAIHLAGARIDATGGAGGARGDQVAGPCDGCNAGGGGGPGYVLLMDADGEVGGLLPGDHDEDPRGVVSVRKFDAARFGAIAAVTELFPVPAADPSFLPLDPDTDVKGTVAPGQRVRLRVSAARASPDDPRLPDLASESPPVEVAVLEPENGATAATRTGDIRDLNVPPGRTPFVRVQARFEYENGAEAALGPFAAVDEVTVRYVFNG